MSGALSIVVDEHAGGMVFSGQELKGRLIVTTTSVLPFTSASILLRGTSKTKFTRTKVEFGAHHGKIGVKPKVETFEQRILLLNATFHMVRPEEGRILQLDPGTHEFRFCFILPPRLPPSVDPVYGCRIRYRLKALVERPELLKINLRTMHDLKVGGYEQGSLAVHALLHPSLSSRIVPAHRSGARTYLGNTGKLVAKLIVDNPCVRMDRPFHVKVHIANQTSGQTVSAVRLHLIQTTEVFAEGESDSSNREHSWSKTPVDIAPGGNCSLNFSPKIGEKWKVYPSVASTLICIRHELELQVCVASRFSIDLRVRLPVRLFRSDLWVPVTSPTLPAPISSVRTSVPATVVQPAQPLVSQVTAPGTAASTSKASPPVSASVASVTDFILPNGSSYTGEILRGKPHGQGTLTTSSYQFVGLFQNGDAVDGVQLDHQMDDEATAETQPAATATDASIKFNGDALIPHLLNLCPACNLPPPSALLPIVDVGWNGVCDTSSWMHSAQSSHLVDQFSDKPLLIFLCRYCPVFDEVIFRAAVDHFESFLSRSGDDCFSDGQRMLELLLANGHVSSIGTPIMPFYCTTINFEAVTGDTVSPLPNSLSDQHYDIEPGSAEASDVVSVPSSSDADHGDFEPLHVPDAVVSVAEAALSCFHKLSNMIMRAMPATIAASTCPWSAISQISSQNTSDAAIFSRFMCTLAKLLPLLSSRKDQLASIALAFDSSFEMCFALLFCGLPSVSMSVLVPLASAVMSDSCGVDSSARLCLLSLGAHALISSGCLADALTLLRCAKSLGDTLADDLPTQSNWLLAFALHQERKAFQDYAGCEEIASRCLSLKSLHPHARVFFSLVQLSVKPVMMKLSGSTGVSRSFSWPVHLQLIDKFALPVPLLLMFENCSSQFLDQSPSSDSEVLLYQEKSAAFVAACFSLRSPKMAIAALFNLKTFWRQDCAICARILASIVDVCRAFELQTLLLQAYDAFIFFSRRNEVLHSCVVSVCNATNDLDALVFNGTTYAGNRMARLVSLSTFYRLGGNKVQSSNLCEQAIHLWVASGDHCASLLQCKLIHSCVYLLCATSNNFRALQLVKVLLCFVQSRSEIHSIDPSLQVWLLQHAGRIHRDRKELSVALSFFHRARDCAADVLSASHAPADVEVEGPLVPDFFSDSTDADEIADVTISAAVDAFKYRNTQFQAMLDQVHAAVWWSRYFAALCMRKIGKIEEGNSDLNQIVVAVRARIGIDRNPELLPAASCKGNTSSNEYVIWNLLGVVSGFLGSIMPITPIQSEEAVYLLTFASKIATHLGQKDQAARWLSLIRAPKARAKLAPVDHVHVAQALTPATSANAHDGPNSASSDEAVGKGTGSGISGGNVATSSPRPAAPRAWMKDEDAPNCCICSVPFSFFRRRHHCRICLRVICGDCCKKVLLAPDSNGAAVASAEAVLCCSQCSQARQKQGQ